MNNEIITCTWCFSEFEIISEEVFGSDNILYCPFCREEIVLVPTYRGVLNL